MDMYDRMENLAKEKGWTVSEFLRRVGLNPGALRDWRAGKASPDKHMDKIIRVLETTEAFLRGETDDPRPDDDQALDTLEYALLDATRDLTREQKLALIEMARTITKNRK